MTNIDRAVAFATANAGTKTLYLAVTPEDVRVRLAASLPAGTFDAKGLVATMSNNAQIFFVTATGRPEQLLALYCDNMFKDEQLAAGPYNLDGVVQQLAEERFRKV